MLRGKCTTELSESTTDHYFLSNRREQSSVKNEPQRAPPPTPARNKTYPRRIHEKRPEALNFGERSAGPWVQLCRQQNPMHRDTSTDHLYSMRHENRTSSSAPPLATAAEYFQSGPCSSSCRARRSATSTASPTLIVMSLKFWGCSWRKKSKGRRKGVFHTHARAHEHAHANTQANAQANTPA